MGGMFAVASKEDCVQDLFYGTDYHSHLGTVRGGLAVKNSKGFTRFIKDITNEQFRSKFEDDLGKMHGSIGVDDQQPPANEQIAASALEAGGPFVKRNGHQLQRPPGPARQRVDEIDVETDPLRKRILEAALYYGLDAIHQGQVAPRYEWEEQ